MYTHETKIRVRYNETDQMGYVHNGNYAIYYDIARTEMLRSLDMTYAQMEEYGVMMPLLELHCKFIRPALYDQQLSIRTVVNDRPGTRITFNHEIFNEDEVLINVGSTILVFFDMARKRPCHPPGYFMEKIAQYFT